MESLQINPLGVSSQSMAMLGQGDGIENSWNLERKQYACELRAVPFYNCRERGFIVYDGGFAWGGNATSKLAVVFCEHRNCDNIVIGKFKRFDTPPTTSDFLDQLPEDATKYNMWDKEFEYGKIVEAADYIVAAFEAEYDNYMEG